MNNTLMFLRNAETVAEPTLPASRWPLSAQGRIQAEMLAKEKAFLKADIIVSSCEDKAYDTAWPIAKTLGKGIDKYAQLNELNRDSSGHLPSEQWNFAIKYGLKNPDKSKAGWELASTALGRFSGKIDELDLAYDRRTILIVTHGIVMNMYFANKLGRMHLVFDRMMKTPFCGWGMIKDGQVVKDII